MRIIVHEFGRVCYDVAPWWQFVREGVKVNCPEPHPTEDAVELDEYMIGK